MKNLALIFLLFTMVLACFQAVLAQEPIKIKLEYSIPKSQKIKLKVTEIPKKYPWLDRDDDGSISELELDSIIVCETIEDNKVIDDSGGTLLIPKGTQFFAKLKEVTKPKSFWRKGQIKLEFYKIATTNYQIKNQDIESLEAYDGKNYIQPKDDLSAHSSQLSPEALSFDSKKSSNTIKNLGENLSSTGGYMLAGAILAPIAVYSITGGLGSLVSTTAITNPYVLGGAAAFGGGVGLVYGLKKKGKKFNLEPGKELDVEVGNSWLLTQSFQDLNTQQLVSQKVTTDSDFGNDRNFKIEITEIKKTKDDFGDKAIRISFNYENHTNEDLAISSFKLIDSMGKEYEPSYLSDEFDLSKEFGELPNKGKLELTFNTDFPDSIHYLRLVRSYDQKTIYAVKIFGVKKKSKK